MRLAILMVAATVLIQLVHGLYRLSVDIPNARKQGVEDLDHLVSSLKPALSFSLFQFDENLSNEILKTFRSYDVVSGAWLLDQENSEVGVWVRINGPTSEYNKEVTWPLIYNDNKVGDLVVLVNMSIIDEKAMAEILRVIGLTSFIGLLALGLLYIIVNFIVTQPIESLSNIVSRINIKSFTKADIKVLDDVRALDEINSLRQSIKAILTELVEHFGDNEQAMILLKEFNRALEDKVTQRTQALQQAIDDAEVANRAKTDFLNVMTHELRTPLNGVLGFSAILKTRDLADKDKLLIDGIEQAGQGLLVLLNDIIDYVDLDSKPLSLQTFSVHDALSSAYKELQPKAQEKGLALEFDVDSSLILNGDPKRLNVLVRQLISNGIKFTAQGSVTIQAKEADDGDVLINIIDTGVGMEASTLSNFKDGLFNQHEQGLDRSNEGIGLGMAIVNRICNKWCGQWWFEENQPHGIRVNIKLGNLKQS
ncbi:HAMP domain-containing sensor histidine kinase [Oceaniserpentilla sp. 4NH20-0058]|uniref:sensor histidine kinase n=1 Tax=Oceaniserpentilla sp. 4NH20-0058 TaxID=3127660 RepID=UPI003341B64F